jgi:vitamin K-dependent gamma-carboxylase
MFTALNQWLWRSTDNAALVVFRIIFGFLLFAESIGAILTGWVRENMVAVSYSFTFIGFEWLNVLIGPGMYAFYAVMGGFGLMVMLGYRYRFAIWAFAVMWLVTYLLQKTSYNNHYYLLIWVCALMGILPAHRSASLDVKLGRTLPSDRIYNWQHWAPVVLMTIAYVYGSVAKIYPDWLDATFIRRAFTHRYETPWLAAIFNANAFHYFIAWSGVFFDLLVVPALLWRRTRLLATIASFGFHLFNSAVFQIGIFPFLSLAFLLFFYQPTAIRKYFLRSPNRDLPAPNYSAAQRGLVGPIAGFFLALHLILPIRHHFIPGNVFWTEEGHRMSWRMMLRSKSGSVIFYVKNKETGVPILFALDQHLSTNNSAPLLPIRICFGNLLNIFGNILKHKTFL